MLAPHKKSINGGFFSHAAENRKIRGICPCPAIREGDTVSVNFDTGVITDETTGETFQAEPFPPFIQKIIRSGGLMASIQAR